MKIKLNQSLRIKTIFRPLGTKELKKWIQKACIFITLSTPKISNEDVQINVCVFGHMHDVNAAHS